MPDPQVIIGLDRLLADPQALLKNKRLGLVANQTSITRDLMHSVEGLNSLDGCRLERLFAPEHGFFGVAQDMEHVARENDPATGLPIFSLYGDKEDSLTPDVSLFKGLDAVVFDVQDIGARYYTFIYTLANCMQTARQAGVELIVLDRPNPITGNLIEGNVVEDGYFSFVGQYPLRTRHGMTVGELARLFRNHFAGMDCELTVVPMEGWRRGMWFDETGLPWIPPSPNMPTLDTATVYPGLCLIEGTLLSEGRGTTRPFEQIGAPGIDPFGLAEALQAIQLPGVRFTPCRFKPGFQKHAGVVCGGVFLHVLDRNRFKPWLTGLVLIETIARLFPDAFAWRTEPYEYVSDRPAIDLLYGNARFREWVDGGQPVSAETALEETGDTVAFETLRASSLLY